MTTPDETALAARENFVKWLEWYKDAFEDESGGSFEQLAPKLGVTGAAISAWRKKGTRRFPTVRNLIRLYALIDKVWSGVRIDDILFRPPPPRPRR